MSDSARKPFAIDYRSPNVRQISVPGFRSRGAVTYAYPSKTTWLSDYHEQVRRRRMREYLRALDEDVPSS